MCAPFAKVLLLPGVVLSTKPFFQDIESSGMIVLDSGSYDTRVGIGGERSPQAVFRTLVGRPGCAPTAARDAGCFRKGYIVGNEAKEKDALLRLNSPISPENSPATECRNERDHYSHGGLVTNWDDMEKVWHHAFFEQLRVQPEDHYVVLTQPALSTIVQGEKVLQVLFETFSVKGVYFVPSPVSALLSQGRETGTVVDCGHSHTTVSAVHEGVLIPGCLHREPIGGSTLNSMIERNILRVTPASGNMCSGQTP